MEEDLLDEVGLSWIQFGPTSPVRTTAVEDDDEFSDHLPHRAGLPWSLPWRQATIEHDHEFSDPGSPDSSSSTSNHLQKLAQKSPRIITIPFRIELDILLRELGLSKATYRLDMCEDSKVQITILFDTSTLPKEDTPQYLTFSGIKCRSYPEAEDSACEKAIKYLEYTTNTIVKDVSYERLLHVKELNEILLEKMKDAHYYKRQLARGWILAVRHMYSFSQQLLNVAYINYDEQDLPNGTWNNLLRNFQNIAFRLQHAGSVLEKRVEEMRLEYFS